MTETLLWYMLNSKLNNTFWPLRAAPYSGVHEINARENIMKIEQKQIPMESPI